MHKKYLTLLLAAFLLACSKEVRPDFSKAQNPQRKPEIDSVYNNLTDFLTETGKYSEVADWLEGENWRLTRYDHYSLILPRDTIYRTEHSTGTEFKFDIISSCYPFSDRLCGEITKTSTYGSNLINFELGENYILAPLSYGESLEQQHWILNPTTYQDSTYSFELKWQKLLNDSVLQISYRQLHSTKPSE